VNLIGEYNIAGDLWGMQPLFDRLGIRILSCISGDAVRGCAATRRLNASSAPSR
jgi:nitrogenase molybdenum-iron protein alpha/beta subunit